MAKKTNEPKRLFYGQITAGKKQLQYDFMAHDNGMHELWISTVEMIEKDVESTQTQVRIEHVEEKRPLTDERKKVIKKDGLTPEITTGKNPLWDKATPEARKDMEKEIEFETILTEKEVQRSIPVVTRERVPNRKILDRFPMYLILSRGQARKFAARYAKLKIS